MIQHYNREAEGKCGLSDHSICKERVTFHTPNRSISPPPTCRANSNRRCSAGRDSADSRTETTRPWRLNLQFARAQTNALLLSCNGDQDPYTECPGASTMGLHWEVSFTGLKNAIPGS